MPTPRKNQRLGAINGSISAGAREIRRLLILARDRMELLIIRSARKKNFMRSRAVRNKLYADLGEEYAALQKDVDAWQKRNVTRTARTWRKFAIADVPKSSYNQTFGQFDKKYLQDMIQRVNPQQGSKVAAVNAQLGGMLESDVRQLRQAVIEVTRQGAETGLTAQEMQKEMLARVTRERPAWSFIDKAGRKWKSENYFKMANQTIAANVSRDSYASVLAESGHDLATIEGGLSTSDDPADPCNKWGGRIISLTGATKGFPTDAQVRADGVFHPNCRHYYGVVLPGELPEAREKEKEANEERLELAREVREDQEKKRVAKAEKTVEGAGKEVIGKAKPLKQREAKLDEKEVDALEEYTSDSFLALNSKIRKGEALSNNQKRIVQDLDSALDKIPDYKGKAFRKITFFDNPEGKKEFLERIKQGKETSFKQYLSSSRDKTHVALASKNDIVFEIKSKTGSSVEKYSKNPAEQEVVFKRNSKFKVVDGGKTKFGATRIILEEIL